MRDYRTLRNIGVPPGPPQAPGRLPALWKGRGARNWAPPGYRNTGPARSAGEKLILPCRPTPADRPG